MSINRYQLVSRHNPIIKEIKYRSPMSVGNGEIAFTVDVTGLQTFYKEYWDNNYPLCTMSQWGWHTKPVNENKHSYTLDDVDMTEYSYDNRKVSYAVKKKEGNEEVYEWLRQNPHRINLAKISLIYKGQRISPDDLSDTYQELKLYEGIIESSFLLHGHKCKVATCCHNDKDTLAFTVESDLIKSKELEVSITFPYGDSNMGASNWKAQDKHTTKVYKENKNSCFLERALDEDKYYIAISSDNDINNNINIIDKHSLTLSSLNKNTLSVTLDFSKEKIDEPSNVKQVFESSKKGWKNYWEEVGIIDLEGSKDPRAFELERRIILSQYLSAIQCCGSMPPQETGLTCNSWHGKFHLEMSLWHLAYLPLWNKSNLIKGSMDWYKDHLKTAKENAKRNDFKGAKWPKQVAYDAIDSPSHIATLLVWQQPHIIYMLELVYQSTRDINVLEDYWELIYETAEFMCDFVVYNEETKKYDLVAPIIPAQEVYDPETTLNPTFEVAYWEFGLNIAIEWAKRLKKGEFQNWVSVRDNMADLPMKDDLYLAHQNCPDTFENYNSDHPSMLAIYGLLNSKRVNKDNIKKTLRKVLDGWNFDSLWGWDFALMAMTAVRIGMPELAIDILLKDSPNNIYEVNGNNRQDKRSDLPLYLPGNGSLLLVVALMVAGIKDSDESLPGFPKNGMWQVKYENIYPFPY